jgi:hypothetical protein
MSCVGLLLEHDHADSQISYTSYIPKMAVAVGATSARWRSWKEGTLRTAPQQQH